MKKIIMSALLVVNIISLVPTIVFGVYGIFEEIMGSGAAERLLEKLHIPLNYNQVLLLGTISFMITIVTYIIRAEMSGRK